MSSERASDRKHVVAGRLDCVACLYDRYGMVCDALQTVSECTRCGSRPTIRSV